MAGEFTGESGRGVIVGKVSGGDGPGKRGDGGVEVGCVGMACGRGCGWGKEVGC